MALVVDKKKKNAPKEIEQKSAGLNRTLWALAVIIVAIAALGNIYLAETYSTPIRVVGMVILIAAALGIASVTNQGKKALGFLQESRTELRRIVWPTRPEAMQTTLLVMAITVITSLILWGFDSIIVTVINFLTDLRF